MDLEISNDVRYLEYVSLIPLSDKGFILFITASDDELAFNPPL